MTAKINSRLMQAINLNPEKKIKVLITLKTGVNPDQLNLPNYDHLMDGIISSSLTADELMALNHKTEIIAIEPDEEMSAF